MTFAWPRWRRNATERRRSATQRRRRNAVGWRWSVAASVALAAVALAPQFYLWTERGRVWNGAAFYFFFDEAAYEAYVNSLSTGRPRLSDPYTGRDDTSAAPQPESLFSIQFVPAYACALPARLFNLSAATIFIILWPLAAFATTLALSRLLRAITDDERTAATLALCILCLSTFIQKTARTLRGLETAYLPLPFLRRYLPALPFALFFVFCLLVWRALTKHKPSALTKDERHVSTKDEPHTLVKDEQHILPNDELSALTNDGRRAALANACFAGLTFALLVYSYFYLWTTAAAWFACFALLWLVASPRAERLRAVRPLLCVAAIATLSLAPYAWLLARRAQTMDAAQALVHTRAPDLFRTSELLGALALSVLIYAAWRKRLAWRDPRTLLAASFALTPFVVFNQQLFTGRSLQPVHYEQFITNYLSLAALAMLSVLLFKRGHDEPHDAITGLATHGHTGAATNAHGGARRAPLRSSILACVALVALVWASFEVFVATRRAADFNLRADEARAVYLRLSEMAEAEGEFQTGGAGVEVKTNGAAGEVETSKAAEEFQMAGERIAGRQRRIVFFPDIALADRLPTVAPQAVLWSPHMSVFSGTTHAEEKERLYQQLYYSNIDAARFADFISRPHPYRTAVFGAARILNGLDATRAPVTAEDTASEVRAYAAYVSSFTRERAAHTPLSYVVTNAAQTDLPNIDRFYTRDTGQRTGNYIIYRVKLRHEETMK